MKAARTLRCLGREPVRRLRLQLIELGVLDDRQRRAGCDGVERVSIERHGAPACRSCSSGGSRTGPPSNTRRSGPTDHAVDDRALEQLPGSADHHPSKAGEPAALVQRPQETLDVGAVLHHHVDMEPVRPRQLLAGIGARQPGAGRAARHPRHATKAGSTDSSASQKPPRRFSSAATSGGHALCVEVKQHERWLPFPVDDGVAGSGD